MLVRPKTPADEEKFFDIRAVVYNSGNPIPPENWPSKYGRHYAAIESDRVVGGYSVLDLPTVVGSSVVPGVGVAAVAVPPDERGGVGTRMMKACVRQSREEGAALSQLFAFRETFYRRAGYETAGARLEVTVRADRFPKITSSLPIRRLGPEAWPELAECHRLFTMRRPGGVIRTGELMWQRITAEGRPLQIYAAGDPVEAYAVVGHKTDFWSVDSIGEVVWSTRAGYEAILGVLRGIAVNKQGLKWFEPANGPMTTIFSDQAVDVTATHPAMYRALDVPKLLATLRAESETEFTVTVHDETIPENTGPWRVIARPDECIVEKSNTDPHGSKIVFTEKTFIQAILGMPSLEELAQDGWVEGTNPLGYTKVFPARNVYLLERY